MTRAIDQTLLWALRVLGLLALIVLVYFAVRVIPIAILVLAGAVAVAVLGFVLVRRRAA